MVNSSVLPLIFEIIVLLILSTTAGIVLFLYVRKRFSRDIISENHTIASYIFNAFSISYGVLLAFVVYANWYDNNRAQQNVAHEAAYISNLYRDTRSLPDSIRKVLTNNISVYTKSIMEDEWIYLSEGKSSPVTDEALDKLWNTFNIIPIEKFSNPQVYQLALERLNFISEYRRLRILDMQQTMPLAMWLVLIVCFIVSLAYTYFFMTKHKKAHLFLIITLITVNVMIFYLIYILDHPYRSNSGISNEPYKTVLQKIEKGK